MTAGEVSKNYHISTDGLQYYEENGFLEHSCYVFDVYEEDAASAKNEIVEWVKATKES